MLRKLLSGLILLSAIICCNKEDSGDSVKQGYGTVWHSGGLAYCASQIHLDNGDKLIVNFAETIAFRSGDRVAVMYRETGINEHCPPGIDCEIIGIKKAD